MEEFRLDIVLGKGPGARTLRLSAPLRDRFGATYRLDLFKPEALEQVVRRSARILKIEIEPAAAREIAKRARGTPRIANRWLKRVRDYAQVRHDGAVTLGVAREALAGLEVDEAGLDKEDRRLLRAIAESFGGGPVGLETLAAAVSEDAETIEDVYEPYLLQEGYLKRTPRGRVATERTFRHLGLAAPKAGTLWNGDE
jgi:Holliday junction DNA helicase RuvB